MRNPYTWTLSRTSLRLGERTAVMGILNVTPDTFSDGGHYFDRERATARGQEIEQEGADSIDVGGESSRPGSEPASEEEELRRVMQVVQSLSRIVRIPISIDTYRARVAERAIDAGAQIVNDISAFRCDDNMPHTVSGKRAGVVLMHSRGNRETLHKQSRMANPVDEVLQGLTVAVE